MYSKFISWGGAVVTQQTGNPEDQARILVCTIHSIFHLSMPIYYWFIEQEAVYWCISPVMLENQAVFIIRAMIGWLFFDEVEIGNK